MHLTNYSINKMSESYVRPTQEDLFTSSKATKRTLASLKASLKENGIDYEKVFRNIEETSKTMM